MNRQKFLIVIDILAFFAFLASLFSGIVLLRQSGQESLYFLGYARHDWSVMHIYASLIFVVIVIIHLIVHWTWIKSIPRLWRGQ